VSHTINGMSLTIVGMSLTIIGAPLTIIGVSLTPIGVSLTIIDVSFGAWNSAFPVSVLGNSVTNFGMFGYVVVGACVCVCVCWCVVPLLTVWKFVQGCGYVSFMYSTYEREKKRSTLGSLFCLFLPSPR